MLSKRKVLTIASVMFCAVCVAAASVSANALHLALSRSVPPKDSTVVAVPAAIKLYFTEAVKTEVSGIRLRAPDNTFVELAPLTLGTERIAPLVATVKGKMVSGRYKVLWRTLGTDGHAMSDSFAFTLKLPAQNDR